MCVFVCVWVSGSFNFCEIIFGYFFVCFCKCSLQFISLLFIFFILFFIFVWICVWRCVVLALSFFRTLFYSIYTILAFAMVLLLQCVRCVCVYMCELIVYLIEFGILVCNYSFHIFFFVSFIFHFIGYICACLRYF